MAVTSAVGGKADIEYRLRPEAKLTAIRALGDSILSISTPIFEDMSLYRPRPRQPSGVPEPCLPTGAKAPPPGPDWIHEIKHDGFRVLAQRAGSKVQLICRNGHDLTYRFPLVAGAMA